MVEKDAETLDTQVEELDFFVKPEDYPGVKPLSATSVIASTENFLLKTSDASKRKKEGAPKIELWPNIDNEQYLPDQE